MELNLRIAVVGATTALLGVGGLLLAAPESPEDAYMDECRILAETDPTLQAFAEGWGGVDATCTQAYLGYQEGHCESRRTKFDLCFGGEGKVTMWDAETSQLLVEE